MKKDKDHYDVNKMTTSPHLTLCTFSLPTPTPTPFTPCNHLNAFLLKYARFP